MNDIEVLKNYINGKKETMKEQLVKAIENLLKERQSDKERIKELEEINEAHKKENGELRERVKDLEEENTEIKQEWCCMTTCLRKDKEKLFLENKIKEKIEELKKYRDIAKELIEEKVVIADSDSLNYGRAEAHDKDIQVLEELLKGE